MEKAQSLDDSDPESIETLVDNGERPNSPSGAQNAAGKTFTATWNNSDAVMLAPSNLALSRPLRGWERAPKSPFARKRVRFGKVWKRPVDTSLQSVNLATESLPNQLPASKEFKAKRAPLLTPTKAVKKICLSNEYGIAPQVSSWDIKASPGRKIITRSRSTEKDMTALMDGDNYDITNHSLVGQSLLMNYVDENGDIAHREHEPDNDLWEDELDECEKVVPDDSTSMHPGDAIDQSSTRAPLFSNARDVVHLEDQQAKQHDALLPSVESLGRPPAKDSYTLGNHDHGKSANVVEGVGEDALPVLGVLGQAQGAQQTTVSAPKLFAQQEGPLTTGRSPEPASKSASILLAQALPAGFVSPGKCPAIMKKRKAPTVGERRKTLPVEFAPTDKVGEALAGHGSHPATNMESHKVTETVLGHTSTKSSSNINKDAKALSPLHAASGMVKTDPAVPSLQESDDEWEDVDDEQQVNQKALPQMVEHNGSGAVEGGTICVESTARELEDPVPAQCGSSEVAFAQQAIAIPPVTSEDNIDNIPPIPDYASKYLQHDTSNGIAEDPEIPRSAVWNSTSKQYAQSAKRTSSRRQSSSPVKQSKIFPLPDMPHFVALTPMNTRPRPPYPVTTSSTSESPSTSETFIPVERSNSAPPEEPAYASPKRQPKPRVSDDTALLQAFLSRAAENRSCERPMSVARRESLEHIRESDTVRVALASSQVSPPEPKAFEYVLGEMDPNSPSLRKLSPVGSSMDGKEQEKKSNLKQRLSLQPSNDISSANSSQPTDEEGQPPAKASRRSGRSKRSGRNHESQIFVAGRPNRISLKANTDPMILKRSEAQGLAQMTRNNTRKNKVGALMPTQRLMKLASDDVSVKNESVENATIVEADAKASKVRWREILAEYCEAPSQPATDLLQLGENGDVVAQPDSTNSLQIDVGEENSARPPAPCDTPSKPKVRKLKAPRDVAAPTETNPDIHSPPQAPIPAQASDAASRNVTVADVKRTQSQSTNETSTKRRVSRIATPAKKTPPEAACLPVQKDLIGTCLQPPKITSPRPQAPTLPNSIPAKRKTNSSRLPALSAAPSNIGQGKENGSTGLPSSMGQISGIASPPKKKMVPSTVKGPKTGVSAKADFAGASSQNKPHFARPPQQNVFGDDEMLALKSPARKGGIGRRMFPSRSGNSALEVDRKDSEENVINLLFSPAKKRGTRRLNG